MRHCVCCSSDNRPMLLQPVSRRVDVRGSDVIGRWSPVPLRVPTRSHGYHMRTASDRTLLVRSVLFRRHVHERGWRKRLPVPMRGWVPGPKLRLVQPVFDDGASMSPRRYLQQSDHWRVFLHVCRRSVH